MSSSELKIRCLLIVLSIWLTASGCQRHVEPTAAERNRISQAITNYCNLGSNAYTKHDIATAHKMFLLASQVPGGENLPQIAGAIEGLAFIEYCQQKLDPSEQHFQRCISIYESPPGGPMNPALVRPLVSLARDYIAQNRVEDAKSVLIRAQQIGSSNPSAVETKQLLRIYENLGIVYMSENQFPQAEDALRHALKIGQHEPGLQPQRIAFLTNNLINVLNQEGKQQEAQALSTNSKM